MTDVIILALVLVAPAALIANFLMWRRYFSDTRRPRSRFFAIMAFGSSLINAGAFSVAFLAMRVLLGLPRIANGAEVTAGALLVVFSVPIFFYVMYIFLPDHSRRG